jgi:hypothetical protein
MCNEITRMNEQRNKHGWGEREEKRRIGESVKRR